MATNVNDLYVNLMYYLRDCPIVDTRNGQAKAAAVPTLYTVTNPRERVLFNPQRRANPYFHVMETIWMFAGLRNVDWLKQFNSQITEYAESNGDINGAYGYRWRKHFDVDQIAGVIKELQERPDSRQAVIAMYDPRVDAMHKP